MTTGRATREQLEELHGLLAVHLRDALRNAQPGSVKASLLNVCRAFLSDNGINAEVRSSRDGAEALSALIATLPDFAPPEPQASTFEPLERHKAN